MTQQNNDNNTTVTQLTERIRQFSADRNWSTKNPADAKNISIALGVEASELMEIFQWVHSDNVVDVLNDPDQFTHIKEEVADVFWYLIRFCDNCGIDLTQAVLEKEVKNAVKYPPVKK